MKSLLAFLLAAGIATAQAQWTEPPATGSPTNHLPDRTNLAGQTGLGPLLIARLLEKQANAKQHRAVVAVQVDGVRLVDPETGHRQPKLDEAHIQYQVDRQPPQHTTDRQWTVNGLSSGEHHIRVQLAASDGRQVGRSTTLKVEIP